MPRLRDNSNRANEMTMLQELTVPAAVAATTPPRPSRDYDQIRRAIAFLSTAWEEQPSLERLAEHLGLSPPTARSSSSAGAA
jgi:transcriptional regulator GlxA family with amidase domain